MENVAKKADYAFMVSEVPQRLRDLRARADVSMAQMANALDLKGSSSYQRYEDESVFIKPYLPIDKAEKLADFLVGLGSPPITRAEVMDLAGVHSTSGLNVGQLEEILGAAFELMQDAGYVEFPQESVMTPHQIAGVIAQVCDTISVNAPGHDPDRVRRQVLRALLENSTRNSRLSG